MATELVATSKVWQTAKAAERWLTAVHSTWLLWRTSLPRSFSRSIRGSTCVTDMQPPVHQAWFDLSTFGTTLSHEILKILLSKGTNVIREACSRSHNQESPRLIRNQMDNYSADKTPSIGTYLTNSIQFNLRSMCTSLHPQKMLLQSFILLQGLKHKIWQNSQSIQVFQFTWPYLAPKFIHTHTLY